MKLINLTPHAINIKPSDDADVISFPSSGVARVSVTQKSVLPIVVDGVDVPVSKNVYGDVEGLPAPQDGVRYIVSALVLSALGGTRDDVFAPDTGASAIRNGAGQIVAVRGLVQ